MAEGKNSGAIMSEMSRKEERPVRLAVSPKRMWGAEGLLVDESLEELKGVLLRTIKIDRDRVLGLVDLTNRHFPETSTLIKDGHRLTVQVSSDWENWVVDYQNASRRADGLILKLPDQIDEGLVDQVRAFLTANFYHGKEAFQRTVWLIGSAKPEDLESLMENLGLVDKKSRTDGTTGLVLVSARPRMQGEHLPIDLTQRDYFDRMRRRVIEGYEDQGWRVLSRAEAVEKCKASKMPPETLSRMRAGFGVFIGADCGCLFKIDFRGDQTQLRHCDGDNCVCDKKTLGEQEPIKINKWVAYQGHDCFECGRVLERQAIGLVGGPQLHEGLVMQKVHFQVRCSNRECGKSHDEPQEVFRFVDPQRLVTPQRRGK